MNARMVALLALALLGAIGPAAAHAAFVRSTPDQCNRYDGCSGGTLFRDDRDEANDVTVTSDAQVVTFRDAAHPLRAEAGCAQVDAHTVTCPGLAVQIELENGNDRLDSTIAATVSLGAGNDRFDGLGTAQGSSGDDHMTAKPGGGVGTSAHLDGGPGDDVLLGGAGGQLLTGGTGRDTIDGGPGDDTISAGDMWPSTREADRVEGGPGRDEVSYSGGAHGVRVDLSDPGPDGGPGEGDVLTGIEDVSGTNGDDVLIGDDGPNVLDGGDGSGRRGDVIEGRGGDDHLVGKATTALDGGSGADRLDGSADGRLAGGPGDDMITAATAAIRGPGRGRSCGAGADLLVADSPMVVPADCERLGIGVGEEIFSERDVAAILDVARARRTRGRTLRLRVGGGASDDGPLTVRWLGDRRRVRVAVTGRRRTVTLRLPPRGRRLALRIGPVEVVVVLRSAV